MNDYLSSFLYLRLTIYPPITATMTMASPPKTKSWGGRPPVAGRATLAVLWTAISVSPLMVKV